MAPSAPSPREEAPAAAADPSACPRCGARLTNPDGLGWCPGCGYCRSLEEVSRPVVPLPEAAAPKAPSALGAAEFGEAMRLMPGWVWPLLGGAAVVAGASVAADQLLPEECLARALWSAVQMVLSLVGLIAAQLWAVMHVGAGEGGLGARDVILPGRLWRATFRSLPATRRPVWLGAWCLTALVCGGAVVGGFDYWLELVKANRLRRIAEAAAARLSPQTADNGAAAPELPGQPARAAEDRQVVAQCVVIGYQSDGKDLTGLVVATTDGDQLKFVGVVREGIDPALAKDLMSRLSGLARQESLIPGLKVKGTTWVKPGVFCDVSHAGADKQGQLEGAKLKKLMD